MTLVVTCAILGFAGCKEGTMAFVIVLSVPPAPYFYDQPHAPEAMTMICSPVSFMRALGIRSVNADIRDDSTTALRGAQISVKRMRIRRMGIRSAGTDARTTKARAMKKSRATSMPPQIIEAIEQLERTNRDAVLFYDIVHYLGATGDAVEPHLESLVREGKVLKFRVPPASILDGYRLPDPLAKLAPRED
jgi:hypothetical protein